MFEHLPKIGDRYLLIENNYFVTLAAQTECLDTTDMELIVAVLLGNFWESRAIMYGFSRSAINYNGASIDQGYSFLKRNYDSLVLNRVLAKNFLESKTSCSILGHDVTFIKSFDPTSSLLRVFPCL